MRGFGDDDRYGESEAGDVGDAGPVYLCGQFGDAGGFGCGILCMESGYRSFFYEYSVYDGYTGGNDHV